MKISTAFRSILILALLFPVLALSQTGLKVLAVRGTVTIAAGKGLKVGQQLASSDKLTVGKNGYIGLAHPNGRTLEIRKEGAYQVKELTSKLSTGTGTASEKFARYIASELTEVEEPIAFSDKRRKNMKITGSVERAAGEDVAVGDTLLTYVGGPGELRSLAEMGTSNIGQGREFIAIMPRHSRILSDSVRFSWHPLPKSTAYKIVFTDRSGTAVASIQTRDTVQTIALSRNGVTEGNLFYWHVEDASDASRKSAQYGLYVITGNDRQQADELIKEVRSSLDDPTSALSHLILASVYEDLGLNHDAYISFRRAVEIAPGIVSYRRLYAEFLLRNSCNIDAFTVYGDSQ